MARVLLDRVSKIYANATAPAVDDLSLDVADGEFIVLVGPSGCGKTTALRLIAGLEELTLGRISIGERDVSDVRPRDRDVAMVFQDYALYPHMTVYENMAFGLKLRKADTKTIESRVHEAARMLALDELLTRRPAQLSGGQRQRVAMGRAIVRRPRVFLMDEPLSNLDARLRVRMRYEIAQLQHELNATTIYVTHDQIEAMTMGDRIAVMRSGVLQQLGTPADIYDSPANTFVAAFMGQPPMNMIGGRIVDDRGTLVVEVGGGRVPLPDVTFGNYVPHRRGLVVVGIRPEHVRLAPPDEAAVDVHAKGESTEVLGPETLAHFTISDPFHDQIAIFSRDRLLTESAERRPDSWYRALVMRMEGSLRGDVGGSHQLRLPVRHMYFFDPESGQTLARPSVSAPGRQLPALSQGR
jgi:multiple sugar transport system ATP-binding protein